MTSPSSPKPGDRFAHARFINADKSPMVFVVTAVRRGVVYYRPEGGGSPFKESVEQFPTRVGASLPRRTE